MNTFLFYDCETSGLDFSYDRVMQFAALRTDMELKPIGEPINILVKLPEDILPSPEALLVTGITPQKAASEGICEAEFARFLNDEVWTPGTIAVGFNNVRFDDRFIQNVLWRNFHDPYEWVWTDNRSRWDILDVARMVRALRPEGIKWPVDSNGKAVNKLELIAKENKLVHKKAHDALSDIEATIEVTKLLRDKQPRMFDYLLKIRGKKEVKKLINLENPAPFIYSSGKYDAEFEKTTVAFPIAPGRNSNSVLVYDLRVDVDTFSEELSESVSAVDRSCMQDSSRPVTSILHPLFHILPVKELAYNHCPAVAPLGVLDEKSQERIKLSLKTVNENMEKIIKNRGLVDKIVDIWNDRPEYPKSSDVEGQLYYSFLPDSDEPRIRKVRECTPEELADFHPRFDDERLTELLFRYKARNFPQSLSKDEQEAWDNYRRVKMERELPGYMNNMAQVAERIADSNQQFILEEIQLWIEGNLVD